MHFGVYFALLLKPDFFYEPEFLIKKDLRRKLDFERADSSWGSCHCRKNQKVVCCGETGFSEVSSRVPFYFNGVRISPCVFIASFLTTVWKTMTNCHNCQEEKLEQVLNIRSHIFSKMVLALKMSNKISWKCSTVQMNLDAFFINNEHQGKREFRL